MTKVAAIAKGRSQKGGRLNGDRHGGPMQSRLFLYPPIIFPDAHPGSVEFKPISRCVGLLDEATGRSSQFLWMGLRRDIC